MGYHFTIDMFQNGWVESYLTIPFFDDQTEAGVPRTVDNDDDEVDD